MKPVEPHESDIDDTTSKSTVRAFRSLWRKKLFASLGLLVVAVAVIWGAWWYFVASNYVSTDDAYVGATSATITPQVAGTILSVAVTDTQHVRRGDILMVLDPADAKLALSQARANYTQARQHVKQYFANTAAASAAVSARQADLIRARLDFDRRARLSAAGAVSGEEISTARNALDSAKAGLAAAQAQRAAAEALIQGSDVAHNPEVLVALAALSKVRLDLARTTIRAPVGGVVAQNRAQIGQRVSVGETLMTVVPVDRVYVNANFKESQLDRVRAGQPVSLVSDLYGSDFTFHGHVVGLGGGTGAAFALIPAQNATGNWIKVVQRLPVRIALNRKELAAHPLRVGLSMTATIDISK